MQGVEWCKIFKIEQLLNLGIDVVRRSRLSTTNYYAFLRKMEIFYTNIIKQAIELNVVEIYPLLSGGMCFLFSNVTEIKSFVDFIEIQHRSFVVFHRIENNVVEILAKNFRWYSLAFNEKGLWSGGEFETPLPERPPI